MVQIHQCLQVFLMLFVLVQDSLELQNVRMILPPVVRAGSSATLLCLFDLERAPLYTVKWYRGQHEFFRYIPRDEPQKKIFYIPGLYIDLSSSNEHQVTLKNVPVHLSGEFKCEVSVDAPTFKTSCVTGYLTILELDVTLDVSSTNYKLGQVLEANCSTIPPNPDAVISFNIGNEVVSSGSQITRHSSDFATLKFLLTRKRFLPRGDFILRCSASLDDLYYVTSAGIRISLNGTDEPIVNKCSGNPLSSLLQHFLIATLVFVK